MCAQMLIFIIKSYIHCVSYPQMLILTLHCHIHFKIVSRGRDIVIVAHLF